ncbi:MAG: hypothetical protein BGO31_11245 [Bacteroidetes bacterium 43-16]|nr:MAG: hypothetical protein BGO31_11245 [Bacteroidetes bacterium 43-16]
MVLFMATKKEDRFQLESLQQKDENFENRLMVFIDKFKDSDPKINRLKTNFDSIPTDKYFFVQFTKEVSKDDSFKMCNYLLAKEEGIDYEKMEKEINDSIGELRSNYNISIFGFQEKSFIGELDKNKRVCRFCKKKQPETSFKKIAHSISEALGNKLIVTYDECDKCNYEFGTGIENDLVLFLDLYRNFFGVKGKNGIPSLKGENYIIRNDGKKQITIEHYLKEGEESSNDFNFTLKNNRFITYLNIYKTLVKYALSVLEPKEIPQFNETIGWIRGEIEFSHLPKIAILQNYDFFRTHPMVTLYKRKDDDHSIPNLVCEFRFTFFVFVFIIPEKEEFIYTEDFYDNFWNLFKHYKDVKGWSFKKFSNPNPIKFNVNLNFKKSDK